MSNVAMRSCVFKKEFKNNINHLNNYVIILWM